MRSEFQTAHPDYYLWLADIKGLYRQVLLKSAMVVNTTAGQTPPIAKQPASQLVGIPCWHCVVILTKCKEPVEAVYYVQQTQAHGWSRSVLTHQIESGLWQREGRAITNFEQTLAVFPREAVTNWYFWSGMRTDEDALIDAMDVAGDHLVPEYGSRNATKRAEEELAWIKELEEVPGEPLDKCRALWDLITKGSEQALLKVLHDAPAMGN